MTDIGPIKQQGTAPAAPRLKPLPDTQMADSYLQERTAVASEGPVMQALRQRLAGETSTGEDDGTRVDTGAKPAGNPGGDRERPQPAAGAAPDGGADRAEGDRGGDAGLGSRLVERLKEGTKQRNWLDATYRLIGGARAVAGDVTGGIAAEGGPAAFRGTAAALGNIFQAGDDLANWLNDNVADLSLGTSKEDVRANNALKKLAEAAGELKNVTGDPQTYTGKAIEVTSQFLSGGKVVSLASKALGMPMSAWTRVIKDMATGATAFDPKGERASDAIDAIGPNPLTNFLKSKPDDSAAEGRLKNALETGGFGLLADGVIKGFKLLRGAAAGKGEALPNGSAGATSEDALKAGEKPTAVKAEPARDWLPIGDPKLPLVEIPKNIEKKAADFLSGVDGISPARVNLARIAGPEDLKKAVDQVAKSLPEPTPQSLAQIVTAARKSGMLAEDVLAGLEGGALDARQITAARMIEVSAAEQLIALAGKARGLGATEQDLAAFNRAFALTYGISQANRGSTAEIARALGAHRIMAASEPDAVKAVRALLDEAGGPDATRDMALKIAGLNDPSKVRDLLDAAAKGTTRDNLSYVYMNLLVSNPASHVANVAGNTTASAINVWERWLAGKIDDGLRAGGFDPGDGVRSGEALAQLYGMQRGTWDGLLASGRAVRTGEQAFGAAKETATGSALGVGSEGASSWLKMLLPARWLGAEDAFFKWQNYRGELSRLAFRDAQDQGLTGAGMRAHIEDVLAHPQPGMHEAAVAVAQRNTFNAPAGPALAKIQEGLKNWTVEIRPGVEVPVGKVVMPFVATPYNIGKWTFERTPGLGLIGREMRADLAAGGARMEMAMAKQATGAAVAGLAWELVQQGTVTGGGPQDAGLRGNLTRQGWQPYSIKIGDRYIGYDRLDTPGQLMGAVADVGDVMTWAKDEDREDLGKAITLAFSRAVMSRSYLSGVAGMVNAMSDPERYGDSYAEKMTGSIVPGIVGNLNLAQDPTRRDTSPGHSGDALADEIREMANAIRARTPGLSKDLPPRTDLWGRDLMVSGAYLGIPGTGVEMDKNWARLLSPFKVSEIKDSPIDAEMTRLRLKIQPVREAMPWPGLPQGVQLEPKELYRYARLQGQEVTDPRSGLNLEETLNAMVRGEGQQGGLYARLPDDGKAMLIKDQVQAFRQQARVELVKEFPALKEAIDDAIETMREAQRPDGAAPAPPSLLNPGAAIVTPSNTRTGTAPVRAPKLN